MLPGIAGIAGIFVLLGGVFGTFEVTTVAFAKENGEAGMAGLLLALYSFGSLAGGLVFGALNLRASLVRQYVTAGCVLGVVTLPIPFLGSVWALGAGALVAGVAVAPVLISGMALVERIVPAARLTESMSWASSGLSVGLAISLPLAGIIVDHRGASTAYLLQAGSALGVAVAAVLLLPTLRRALSHAERREVRSSRYSPPPVQVTQQVDLRAVVADLPVDVQDERRHRVGFEAGFAAPVGQLRRGQPTNPLVPEPVSLVQPVSASVADIG